MTTKYMVVSKSGDSFELKESSVPMKNTEFTLLHTPTNTVYPLDIFDVILDGGYYEVSTKKFSPDDCILIYTKDIQTILNNRSKIIAKTAEKHILSPVTYQYQPFTRAVLLLIMDKGKELPLEQKTYDKKLYLIREFNKVSNGQSEVSLKKAIELLSLYNLSIEDVIKSEYVIPNNK